MFFQGLGRIFIIYSFIVCAFCQLEEVGKKKQREKMSKVSVQSALFRWDRWRYFDWFSAWKNVWRFFWINFKFHVGFWNVRTKFSMGKRLNSLQTFPFIKPNWKEACQRISPRSQRQNVKLHPFKVPKYFLNLLIFHFIMYQNFVSHGT